MLDEDDVQLSVLWMESPSSARKGRALKKFLREHSNKIAYLRTGPPDSDEAVLAMVGVVAAALADITRGQRREELFSEHR